VSVASKNTPQISSNNKAVTAQRVTNASIYEMKKKKKD